jgi:GNAT superfamily N-acetyltransferase
MESKPLSAFPIDELVKLWNEAFAGYIGQIPDFTPETLTAHFKKAGIDLEYSKVFIVDGEPVGFGYISPRGTELRLAAMGIIPSARSKGVGTRGMELLIEEAKARGDTLFELEVIQQNTPAVRLYKHVGFEVLRALTGWEAEDPRLKEPTPPGATDSSSELEVIPAREIAQVVSQHGAPNLPWQIAGFALEKYGPPGWIAMRLGQAYTMVSDPEKETIKMLSVVVPEANRRHGGATRLLNAVFNKYPGKKWLASAIFPDENARGLAEKFGFKAQDISQYQMRLSLVAK